MSGHATDDGETLAIGGNFSVLLIVSWSMPLTVRPRHVGGVMVVLLVALATWLAMTRSTPISTSGFTPFRLDQIDLSEVSPGEPVDYLEVRESLGDGPGEQRATWGTPCATATQPAACQQELTELISAHGPTIHQPCGICSSYRLFATRGDQVLVVTDPRGFVGSIDSATEAALAAGVGSWVKAVDGGYEVIESHYTAECDPIVEVTTLRQVAVDGTVTEIDRHTTTERGACI